MTHSEATSPPSEAQRTTESAARSAIEARLTAICEAALGGKRVHAHDNLFELGASSLRLIEIHEQIEQEYPGQIDLMEFFDYPSVADLARYLHGKVAAPG